MNAFVKSVMIALGPLALVACSSGGGDDTSVTLADPAEITSDNAPIIAGAVVQTTYEGGALGTFAGLGSGAVLTAPGSQLFAKLGGIQKTQTDALQQKAQIGILAATLPTETEACLNGGTVTLSGQVSNPLTLSPADTFTLVYSGCDDGEGIINGTYAMTVTGFNGDLLSGSFSLRVTVALTAFAVTDTGSTVTANGNVSMTLDAMAAPAFEMLVSTNSLTVSDGISSHTLDGFSLSQTVDELTGAFTMTVSGGLESSAFVGRVTFNTVESLDGDGTGYAFSGEITIEGAGGATIDVIVLDAMLVQLQIDLDGNGIVDELVDTTWDELTLPSGG